GRPFREGDPLGGHDPYSASKSAAELATTAYAHAFFEPRGVIVATARGGNVIGGGDFAANRIVPDVFRAMCSGQELVLRHPQALAARSRLPCRLPHLRSMSSTTRRHSALAQLRSI